MALFSWFSYISGVKGWIFKCSQQSGRECCFTPNFQQFCCVKACLFYPSQSFCCPCEYLKMQAFTRKNYENQQKTRDVWRGEYFFREIKCVYTRAQEGANPCHVHGWEGCLHSRRVVFLNRRFVFSNRRVVKPTPGFVKPTPGLVTAIQRGNFCLFGRQFAETVQLNDTLFAKNNLPL